MRKDIDRKKMIHIDRIREDEREERTTGIFLDERASLLAKGSNVPTCRLSFSYFVRHVRRTHQIKHNFSFIFELCIAFSISYFQESRKLVPCLVVNQKYIVVNEKDRCTSICYLFLLKKVSLIIF